MNATSTQKRTHRGRACTLAQLVLVTMIMFLLAPDRMYAQQPLPDITLMISGVGGDNGWFVSDVTVSWQVINGTIVSGCGTNTVTTDTASTVFFFARPPMVKSPRAKVSRSAAIRPHQP